MAAMVAEFREGTTLAEWRKARPADRVGRFEVKAADGHRGADTDWCARASATVRLADGGSVERTAYFFAPERKTEQPLPPQDSDPDLISICTLEHLWVEIMPPTVETGTALAQQLRAALQQRFGAPETKAEVSFLGSAAWDQKSKWKNGNTLIVSAYDQTIGGEGRKRVLALVTTAVADKYGFNFGVVKGFEDDYAPTRESLRRVERAAGLEEQVAALEAFLDASNPNREGAPQEPCGDGAELPKVLTRWLETAKQWEGQRRAAVLLVADLATTVSQKCYLDENQEATRGQLKALGAGLEYSPLGAAWVYTRSWLRQVVRTQPTGQIGEMAFVEWMGTGFREGCCCQGESPERVIKEGERYLQQKRTPETEAQVHFLLADAYRDIVALAGGAGMEYGSPEVYEPQAPQARLKALAHYRAGLKLESQSEQAQHAWREAWRLIAGLTTGETRFFCVYD